MMMMINFSIEIWIIIKRPMLMLYTWLANTLPAMCTVKNVYHYLWLHGRCAHSRPCIRPDGNF